MSDAKLVPGRHKRKNQKQILAMLRSFAGKAGLEWSETAETSSRGVCRGTRAGELALEVHYEFGTSEIRFRMGPPGGAASECEALYTDTDWMLATFHEVLGLEPS